MPEKMPSLIRSQKFLLTGLFLINLLYHSTGSNKHSCKNLHMNKVSKIKLIKTGKW